MNIKKERAYDKIEYSLKKLRQERPIIGWEIREFDEYGKIFFITIISRNKGVIEERNFFYVEC